MTPTASYTVEQVGFDPGSAVTLSTVDVEQSINNFRTKSEVVIYYRKPQLHHATGERLVEAGWITWSDSQTGKRADRMTEGWEPLPQFGRISDSPTDFAGRHFIQYGPWGPILAHPQGPAQFPAEQVLTYRWYDPAKLGSPGAGRAKAFPHGTPCDACGQVHNVYFPQIDGVEILEYDCVECNSRSFFDPIFLARHLRNSHEYSREDISALGKEMDIDFSKIFARGAKIRKVYSAPETAFQPAVEVVAPPLATVNLRKGVVPDVKARTQTAEPNFETPKRKQSEAQLANLAKGREAAAAKRAAAAGETA